MISVQRMKELFTFSLPIIAGQIGQMLFGVGDIIVAGRYSTEVVSAIGVAGGIFAPFILIGLGLCFAVSPLTSKALGEKRPIESLLASAYTLGLLISIILIAVLCVLITNLSLFNLLPEIEPLVADYLWIVAPSLIGIIHFQISKEYLQALDDTYFSNGLVLFFNLINIGLNIILIFGLWFIPEMGIKGAALGSLIGRILMAVTLFLYLRRRFEFSSKPKRKEMLEIFHLGFPISISTFFEVMVFSAVTVLIGKMDVLTSAAHNIVLTMASLTFMVPLGMSSACSVKIAMSYGKSQYQELKEFAVAGLMLSTLFMASTALSYFIIPHFLVRFATNDPALISAAVNLLFFAALFQIPDGLQVTLLGILRGLGITKLPMLLTFIANWLIGLPIGFYFATQTDMKARGLWLGLTIGLTLMSIALTILFIHDYNKKALRFHEGPHHNS